MGTPLGGKRTVLVVDDDEPARIAAQRIFEQAGFSVVTAGNGVEALGVYHQHRDQIVGVFLDLNMPKMDGEQTLREIRRIDSHVHAMVASGCDAAVVAERFAGLDVLGFVQKPDPVDSIIGKLWEAISKDDRAQS